MLGINFKLSRWIKDELQPTHASWLCVFQGWLAEVEERMPSKSDTHRRSGLYETQNNMTVANNCAQDRERYGILWKTSKRQTQELWHTLFSRKKTMYVFTVYLLCVCWPLSSPDGSYTEEQNSETQVKANINPTSTTPEFDDEFDDEEVLPTIGTCKALYPFEGNCNHKCCKQPESNTQTMED